jgi:RNA polymerase sigma factor (sigma-70 family)
MTDLNIAFQAGDELSLKPAVNNISEASSLDIYSQELSRLDLLSADAERQLGREIDLVISEMVELICESEEGLQVLADELDTYLFSYQDCMGQATKRWKFSKEPAYIANLLHTLIDTLEVMLLLNEESKQQKIILGNLIQLLGNLTFGREKLVRILTSGLRYTEKVESLIDRYEKLRSKLIEKNLRLVYVVALRFKNSGVGLDDLIQEGNIGLLKAADRFNFVHGYRFSTYAFWCIQNVLKTALQKNYHTISRPSYLQEKLSVIKRESVRFLSLHGRYPGTTELSELTSIPEATLEKIKSFPAEPLSLSQPVNRTQEGENLTVESTLEDRAMAAEKETDIALKRRMLERMSLRLNEREYKVLKMRYGIDCHTEHTLEEISHQLNVSVERVRQLQKIALEKLQTTFAPDSQNN